MINAAICDDEKYFADELYTLTKKIFTENKIDVTIKKYISGTSLTENADDLDLIFLDVSMENQDGFETADILRKNGFSGCLIFVTIMKDDMYRSFDYGAFDYLVKPLSEDAFRHTMSRFFKYLNDSGHSLAVCRKGEQLIVKTADIIYCEVIDRKVILHLTNKRTIEYYCKISELENKLGRQFCRSHRSYIVNLKYIVSCGANEITLTNGEKVPVSRSRRNDLMNALIDDFDKL